MRTAQASDDSSDRRLKLPECEQKGWRIKLFFLQKPVVKREESADIILGAFVVPKEGLEGESS